MRKSISTAFFSMVSTLMVLGIVLMGCSEWVLFKNYFAKDRYETLDQVVNVAKRTAEYLVNSETMPQGAELDALNTKLEIIGESAEAYLFFTDRQGNVLIASDPDKLTTGTVPLDICQRANAVADPDARPRAGELTLQQCTRSPAERPWATCPPAPHCARGRAAQNTRRTPCSSLQNR